jgi:predicted permease
VSFALLLLPDFLLIIGGALLKRVRGYDTAFWSGVERLVYFVLFPALLFRSIARSPLESGDVTRLIATGVAFTIAGMLLSLAARPLFRLPHPTFAACFQCGFRFNTYIALAAASRYGGESALALISLLVGVLVPLVNFAAVGMLAHGGRKRIVIELARNPLLLACVAGYAWRWGGLALPDIVMHILELLAAAALPLGLLAVGAGLTLARTTLPVPAIAWWHAVKLVALPAIALAVGHALGLNTTERAVAVIMAAVPTAPSAYILATQMNGHGAPVALLISSGTVIAAVTLPLWLAIAGSLG